MKSILIYLLIINSVTFYIYGLDKKRAVENRWRISERMLLGLAAIGGSVGALAGMRVFRHKTKHLKFYAGIPVILAVQIVGVCLAIK